MPAKPRSKVFDPDRVGVYHCWNRLVRRRHLFGWDAFTGKDFGYRKDWVRDRFRQLAGAMAIDIARESEEERRRWFVATPMSITRYSWSMAARMETFRPAPLSPAAVRCCIICHSASAGSATCAPCMTA